jgi:5-(carboxyamino)imidazole ribonucleotide synthase
MATTLGILGAGQLAQMLCMAAKALDLPTLCLAHHPSDCAGLVSELLVDAHKDATLWQAFCDRTDLVTLETENIPLDLAEFISAQRPLLPNLNTLAISQDRGHEKATFHLLGIPTAPYHLVDSRTDLEEAIRALGFPLVLKTRRFGYDGKGQFVLRNEGDLEAAWDALKKESLIAEGFVHFETELSLLGARSTAGEIVFYPLVENTHRNGILHQTVAPYLNDALTEQAKQYMSILLDHLNYRGLMAIEFFVKEGHLIANEMAPRVHNTGHWSIEGASISQFEQHLRAITGLPLKPVHLKGTSVMLNCIGALPDKKALSLIPHAYFHDYGKTLQPGRKVGHVTVVHHDRAQALAIAEKVRALWNQS